MEIPSPRCKFSLIIIFFIISLSLGFVSFIFCIAAELVRNKEDDLRWNGKLCYLPTSPSFGLGIAALVTLFIAHIIGNTIMFKSSCSSKIPPLAKILWFISCAEITKSKVMFGRLSFGIAVILLIAATSMSRRQVYGVGWLNGECYLVKGGTYAGSAILVLLTIGSINASAFSTSQFHLTNKIHKQMG
ncbi:protein MODIFYING WALL LIGNIN-1-like isoform X1 [Arachis stenosperma]|uniref:protein MODIFYING WALL LIGNIN-1-like isoform X1 n=1 Tax=Arachis stenosperma TaxID=217475 RepID=UPI0025AC4DA4|nr:protein MODIFYING WALL LIGNIN-1-like isoform X1 [Arachis stenosperma]